MDLTALTPLVGKGLLLGWSVAWPPGPINAEMIRRGLAGRLGARFATPAWDVATRAATGAPMLYFALRLALRLASG